MEKQRKQSFPYEVGAKQLNGLFVEFKTTIIKSHTRARGGTQWVWRDVNTALHATIQVILTTTSRRPPRKE